MGKKAVGLLSGGLDSTLAARLLLDQGIAVHAINFTTPFCTCTPKSRGCASIITAARQLGDIPLQRVALGDEYIDIIRKPRFGYGKGINPCLDCRIFKIKIAFEYMKEIGASFLFTGEVLGQRPMSQHRRALNLIDRESGVTDLILRPLSANHFQPSLPEKEGWVDRNALLAIKGRSRKDQMTLAQDMGINDYPCPAGGCLLTDKIFSQRLKDYFEHTPKPTAKDMALLKIGRHFRLENGDKIIIARNEKECTNMTSLNRNDFFMLIPENFSGPTVILQGTDRESALEKLFKYTNASLPPHPIVSCYHQGEENRISVKKR